MFSNYAAEVMKRGKENRRKQKSVSHQSRKQAYLDGVFGNFRSKTHTLVQCIMLFTLHNQTNETIF